MTDESEAKERWLDPGDFKSVSRPTETPLEKFDPLATQVRGLTNAVAFSGNGNEFEVLVGFDQGVDDLVGG